MAGKKTKKGGGIPPGPTRTKEVARMLIRNEIPAAAFKLAYGKYNYVKSAR